MPMDGTTHQFMFLIGPSKYLHQSIG